MTPKFVVISSRAGSITEGTKASFGVLPYGVSKAGANYLARKLHYENKGLIVFPITPGPVDTDMTKPAKDTGFFNGKDLPSVESVVAKLLPLIDNATRPDDENGPPFLTVDGTTCEW